MLYVLLKLLLPYPLAVAVPVSPPYHPPHLVTALQPGTYRAEQWGNADMTLALNADQNTYHAHFDTDDGPHDYNLSFYAMPCLPRGKWLVVKQRLDKDEPVRYTVGSWYDGELQLYAISRADQNNGIMAPQLQSTAAEVDTLIADYCDRSDIVTTLGESPTVYSYAKP